VADRSVVIRLKADVTDYSSKLKQATADTERLGVTGATAAEKHSKALQQLGGQAGKIGLVAAAGVAAVVTTAANFESAMSNVAATGDDARGSLDALREAAIEAGAQTAFSASEAAAGIENLAKAGVSAEDTLGGGLQGALDLAAAGQIEVADAAEIAATAMTQFSLAGSDVPHIADLLAAAAGKAQGEVSDMAQALKYVGPVAAQMGVSIEETAGSIAYLASQGVLGDQAGTSLRGMLTALTSPSKIAADTMKQLGINMYDASGAFVGLDGIAGQLQTSMSGLGEAERDAALGRLFGNEQITTARILYAGGEGAIRDWTGAVDDSGYAAETAAIKMDNLKGDFEAFLGSLETALIGAGDGSQNAARSVVQGATDIVNALSAIPGPVLDVTTGLAGIVALTGGSLWLGTRAIGAVKAFRESLDTITTSAQSAKGALGQMGAKAVAVRSGAAVAGMALATTDLASGSDKASVAVNALGNTAGGALLGFAAGGPIGAAIGGGIGALTSLGGAFVASTKDAGESKGLIAEYTQTLDAMTGAVTESTEAMVTNKLEGEGHLETLEASGLSTDEAVDAIVRGGAALRDFTQGLRDEKAGLEATYDALKGYTYQNMQGVDVIVTETEAKKAWLADNQKHIDGLNELIGYVDGESTAIGKSVDGKQREIRATDGVVDAKGKDKVATDDLRGAYDDATDEVDGLAEAIAELEVVLTKRGAKRDFEQSVDDFAEAVKKRKELIQDLADAEADLASADTETERDTARDRIKGIKEELADYKLTLDEGEEAGRNWQERLESIATEGLKVADTLGAVGEKRYLERTRKEFRLAAEELGLNRKQIRKLMEDLHLLDGVVVKPKEVVVTMRIVKGKGPLLPPGPLDPYLYGPGGKDGDPKTPWADGGFTGPGSKYQPAGIVHAGEYVFSADATRGNVAYLDSLHRSMRGYASGGPVAASRPAPMPMGGGMGAGIDYDRLAASLATIRPLYGDVHMQPHDYNQFRREMGRDRALAGSDGMGRR
jgi:TP901 family phage tail tape measure protein